MAKTARNEARKLSATFINGIALSVLSFGAIGPAITWNGAGALSVFALSLVASILLHMLARLVVRRVED
jgi:hypothetical protein